MRFPFSPFPELRTARLCLRELTLDDAPAVFRMRSNPRVMAHLPRPLHTNVEESRALLERIINDFHQENGISWAICLPDNPELIGNIGLWQLDKPNHCAEIGYMLHCDHWGLGYATEALAAVEAFGFREMELHRIEGHVGPEHTASIRVLERCGFQKEAHFRENCLWEGRFLDTLVYGKVSPCH